MSLRFPPNCSLFQKPLSAVLERIQGLTPRPSVLDQIDPRWQPELALIRQEINGDNLSRDAVIYRTVRLAQRLVRASGVGVWLLADDDIFYCEGAGSASNDER